MSYKVASRLASAFGYDVTYLTTGEGSLFDRIEDDEKPFSYKLLFPKDTPSRDVDEIARGHAVESAEVNETLWTACTAMLDRMNQAERAYKQAFATVKNLSKLMHKDSDEYKQAQQIVSQCEKTSFGSTQL